MSEVWRLKKGVLEMKKSLRQSITGYDMPLYMQEILCNNYCPNFLKMTIINESSSYMFYYETGVRRKLDYRKLTTRDKLVLLMNLMTVNFENEEWLVKGESYLLEPELIYSMDNRVEYGALRILFYPDFKSQDFSVKIAIFADKIKNNNDSVECNYIEQFKNTVITGDQYKAKRLLENNIDRLEFGKVV